MKYDIITFGSGTRDVYLIGKGFKIVEEKKFFSGKGLAVSLGGKIEVENILFRTGGGATNTAATFKKQGFKVAWCGMIGRDLGGREIVRQLKGLGIRTGLIFKTDKKPTNYSVILCAPEAPDKERTILVYHGASSELSANLIPWKKLRANWFYLAPLSGKTAGLFAGLASFAVSRGIRIAVNPGNTQLKMTGTKLRSILAKTDILFLNQEEAAMLVGKKYILDRELLKKVWHICKSIAVITKGPLGAAATDGKDIFTIPVLKTKVIDRTGAGDSFCAGFLSEYIRSNSIERALQLGIANSAANIAKWGAKEDLLPKGAHFKKMPVKITSLR